MSLESPEKGEVEKNADHILVRASGEATTSAVLNGESGNVLQLEGDILPKTTSIAEAEEGAQLPVSDLKDSNLHSPPLLDAHGILEEPTLRDSDYLVSNVDESLVVSDTGKSLGDLAAGTGGRQLNVGDLNETDSEGDMLISPAVSLPSATVNSPKLDSTGSLPSTGEGELSWVLSQMNASNSKLKSTDSVGSISSDVGKIGAGDDLGLDITESFGIEGADFIDEPIELRKKEQEALIGRMSAQIDGKVADENLSGGLNSSLANSSVSRSAFSLAAGPNGTPANLAMNLPPNHPGWADEISQKVSWVAREGGHTAHIRLDPPELGSLTVKISVDNDSNTQVSFIAATPQARDLLEGQMSRLRDMLAQQGMDLSRAEVDVSQQDASGMQRGNEENNRSSRGDIASQEELDEDLIASNASYVSATGVDYYA